MWAVALSTERSPSSVESVKDSLTILASLIVPGLGQLRLGRALDGALFLALAALVLFVPQGVPRAAARQLDVRHRERRLSRRDS